MTRLGAILLFGTSFIGSLSCKSSAACKVTSDCAPGLFCNAGSCTTKACASDTNCAAGQVCSAQGVCVSGRAAPQITSVTGTGPGGPTGPSSIDPSSGLLKISGSNLTTVTGVHLLDSALNQLGDFTLVGTAQAAEVDVAMTSQLASAIIASSDHTFTIQADSPNGIARNTLQILQGVPGTAGSNGALTLPFSQSVDSSVAPVFEVSNAPAPLIPPSYANSSAFLGYSHYASGVLGVTDVAANGVVGEHASLTGAGNGVYAESQVAGRCWRARGQHGNANRWASGAGSLGHWQFGAEQRCNERRQLTHVHARPHTKQRSDRGPIRLLHVRWLGTGLDGRHQHARSGCTDRGQLCRLG